jgi:hypothetical protein
MLTQKSKQPLTDAEREVTKTVVERFVKNDEATSERFLMRELKAVRRSIPDAVRRMVGRSVFKTLNNTQGEEIYVPNAIAFHYCGDGDFLAFAKKSTEIVLRVIRNLYERELETDGDSNQKPFTSQDAEAEARAIHSTVTPDMIRIGLALAEEFSVFRTLQRNAQQIGVMTFLPGKHIFQLSDNPWDEHIRKCGVWLENDPEDQRPSENVLFTGGWPANAVLPLLTPDNGKVFIVHGHAEEPKKAVATFLRALQLEVVILHEKANEGQTIIEKFEKHSDVGFAVVLLTPDDVGASALQPEQTQRRARQNVILELGYFLAKLGRNRVCCLYVEGVELPSDYHGVLYVPYDADGDWRWKLVKELTAAGIEFDAQILSALKNWDTTTEISAAIQVHKMGTLKEITGPGA